MSKTDRKQMKLEVTSKYGKVSPDVEKAVVNEAYGKKAKFINRDGSKVVSAK